MLLDLTSIKRAVNTFEDSLAFIVTKQKDVNTIEIDTLRAGVIQKFEFTYELCWKFMKRWIENNINSEIVDGVPRIELFRVCAQYKLIDDVTKWMEFHKARNKTSHIYDEEVANACEQAMEVFNIAKEFLSHAIKLLERLEDKNI